MSYCTRSDIETRFGAANVRKWADLDNSNDDTTISDRIDAAIQSVQDSQIDPALRCGPYTMPMSDPVDPLITDIAARLAGVWLYEARGVEDINEITGQPNHRLAWAKKDALRMLAMVQSGALKLSTAAGQRAIAAPRFLKPSDECSSQCGCCGGYHAPASRCPASGCCNG